MADDKNNIEFDKDIMELDAVNLLNKKLIDGIFNLRDTHERERLKGLMIVRAKELKIQSPLNKIFKEREATIRRIENFVNKECADASRKILLVSGADGKPLNIIENYLTILEEDEYFYNFQYNEFAKIPELNVYGTARQWTDTDESRARQYIESKYKIHSEKKFSDALRIFFDEKSYNPIKSLIEAEKWDGKERIPIMLTKWLKCDNSDYTKEVSRLIFAGGINRIYEPGCKFDDVPVLIGTNQGEGKSTFVRWLALKDDYFTEINDIEGQKGAEILQGAWICEIAELLALTRAKEVEAVKSFLSRSTDKYRIPYDKNVTAHKRQCIFIGTTNKLQFLTDKTGNRRFYPVLVHQNGFELYKHEKEVKADILQCWAEAKAKYDKGDLQPFLSPDILETAKERQSEASEDDYRVGMIEEYLSAKNFVCAGELWKYALKNEFKEPTRKDINDIVLIMQSFPLWKRTGKRLRFSEFGRQRIWEKII